MATTSRSLKTSPTARSDASVAAEELECARHRVRSARAVETLEVAVRDLTPNDHRGKRNDDPLIELRPCRQERRSQQRRRRNRDQTTYENVYGPPREVARHAHAKEHSGGATRRPVLSYPRAALAGRVAHPGSRAMVRPSLTAESRHSVRPLVSVIVPVRDGTHHLEKLVQALDQQTLSREHFEVIVSDDGSLDPPLDFETADGHCKVLRGPATNSFAARNRGVDGIQWRHPGLLRRGLRSGTWLARARDSGTRICRPRRRPDSFHQSCTPHRVDTHRHGHVEKPKGPGGEGACRDRESLHQTGALRPVRRIRYLGQWLRRLRARASAVSSRAVGCTTRTTQSRGIRPVRQAEASSGLIGSTAARMPSIRRSTVFE